MMAIFKRELRSYFQNPTGYVFLGLFLLVSGLMFSFGNVMGRSSDFPGLIGSIHFLLVITVPILTMRSFSEELRQKTDQLLLTSPITVRALVAGKYLAAMVVFLAVVVVATAYAVTIAIFGDLSFSQSAGAMSGFFLAGACYVATGIFISTKSDNQAVVAVGTFTALLLLQMVEYIRAGVPRNEAMGLALAICLVLGASWAIRMASSSWILAFVAGLLGALALVVLRLADQTFFPGFVDEVLGLFSVARRHQRFVDGIFALEDLVYMLSAIFTMLFLSVRSIEKRR